MKENQTHNYVSALSALIFCLKATTKETSSIVVSFRSTNKNSRNNGMDVSVTPLYTIGKVKLLPQKHSFTVKYVLNIFDKEDRNTFNGVFNFQFSFCNKFCRLFAFLNLNVVTYKLRVDPGH
jgi:hypothetical protein